MNLNFNINAGAGRAGMLALDSRIASAVAPKRLNEIGAPLSVDARLLSAGNSNTKASFSQTPAHGGGIQFDPLSPASELWFQGPQQETPSAKPKFTSSFMAPGKKGIVDEKRTVPPVGYYNCYGASPPRKLPEGLKKLRPKLSPRFPSDKHPDAELPYKNLLARYDQSSFFERRAFEFARLQKRDEVSYLRDYARISEAKTAGIDPQYWPVFNFKHKKSKSMMANSIEYQNAQSHIGFGGSFGDAEALKARIVELKEITSQLAKTAY